MHWRKGNGIHAGTPTYKWGDKTVNAGWVTTFSEYAVISENRLTPIPQDYDLKIAPLYGCALTTAFGVINNNAKLKTGESILIFGTGGVGNAIVFMASLASANPIIAVDINDFKLANAKKHGATHIINSKKEDAAKKVLEMFPQGVDVAVDTTGIKEIRELAYELTSAEGITVLVGVPKKGEKMCIDSFPLHFYKKITGSHGGESMPSRDIPRLIRLHQTKKYDLNGMISHYFPLDKINEAIQLVRTGDAIRCIIKMV